ncbi:MAG: hypothetical protein KF830_01985 [Planctomycetes bacterium]|nr:hypothetical protein [Planctomycetota bacterium]
MTRSPFVPSRAAAALFATTCAAQVDLVLPPEYDLAWGRGSSAVLGSNSSRTQMIFASPFAPGTVVTAVGVRPTANTAGRAAAARPRVCENPRRGFP